jgi:N utilization substance protein B
MDVLYGADVRGESINASLLAEENRHLADPKRGSSWEYASQLVRGVAEQGDEIDELIETYAQGWTIDRMPALDRAIIRLGIWEVLFNAEVPDGVAIAEAVELATLYSTEDSGSFVNGLLGRIASTRV